MSLAAIYARVRATEITEWPADVQAHAFAMPMLSVPVGAMPMGFAAAGPLPASHASDLFPKLGVKSWQETGRLRIIPAGQPLADQVAARLATPTRQQLLLQAAWPAGEMQLHLFAAQDFTAISEARYLVSGGNAARSTLCLRGTEQIVMQAADYALSLATGAAARLEAGSVIVQIAFEPGGRVSILDINPALTPQQTEALLLAPPPQVPQKVT